MSDLTMSLDTRDQKNMIIVGVIAALLIIYSVYFAKQMPYSITQYLSYSVTKLLLFIIIAILTYASPTLGIVTLIAVFATFHYYYMQMAFVSNVSNTVQMKKQQVMNNMEAEKAGEEITKESMATLGNENASYMLIDNNFTSGQAYPIGFDGNNAEKYDDKFIKDCYGNKNPHDNPYPSFVNERNAQVYTNYTYPVKGFNYDAPYDAYDQRANIN